MEFLRDRQTVDSCCATLIFYLVLFVAFRLKRHVYIRFQHNDAAIHSPRTTNDWIRYSSTRSILWLARPLEVNPIENL